MNSVKIEKLNTMHSNVGTRVKEFRKQAGMTLNNLAERTGLTASFISQVERGRASLSLNSLQALASALEIPVFQFIATEPSTEDKTLSTPMSSNSDKFNPVVSPGKRSRFVLPDTGLELELLVPNIGRKLLSFKARLAPRTFHVAHPLIEPTEEILYVIAGTLTLEFTDALYVLHPEETIYFEGEKLLRMINNSETEEVVWISTITPGVF
ncbi:MAG: helix-turn-helix transcriptional regulator [Anaerolineaceae bacterium]|nr:helix-turn-helix transcriptional regulator [Anaerolineaceae bacterium]